MHSTLLGSKVVIQGSSWISLRPICPEILCGNQVWSKELLTRVQCIVAVFKGHAGVVLGKPEVNLCKNVLCLCRSYMASKLLLMRTKIFQIVLYSLIEHNKLILCYCPGVPRSFEICTSASPVIASA